MSVPPQSPIDVSSRVLVPSGEDRNGKFKVLGINQIALKVSRKETPDVFMVELTRERKGGPAKHVHLDADEWWYLLEGDLVVEVGDERFRLKPGDSLFGRRNVPHVWANAGNSRLRFLAFLSPAGNAEAFFENASRNGFMPGPDQNLWRPYGLEWVGPPLKIE